MKESKQLTNAHGQIENGQRRDVKYDLEERLLDFTVRIIEVVEGLPNTQTGSHIAGQLLRCGTSPAPNYGEAQSAESRKDFIHKMKICLKELRETNVWLKIVRRRNLFRRKDELEALIVECNELTAIFVKSIKTAKDNMGIRKG